MRHKETHKSHRSGWLRAAVLGANDGIISTASLMTGIAAAAQSGTSILLVGVAGMVAGAVSMAAGEYVSVCSQLDLEKSDIAREKKELVENPEGELAELESIYIARGISKNLARQVALELTQKDALAAHARDELGITEFNAAKPLQAAFSSAISFALGAAVPIAVAIVSTQWLAIPLVSLLSLGILGCLAAKAGGADPMTGAARVTFWGAAAMGVTALAGKLFGVML
jgi:VIT1/CCC1 family predicted Fe2+/Mn2+ transporter